MGTVLYAAAVAIFLPHGGGLILLGALTLGVTLLRLGLPLLVASAASCRTSGFGARSSRAPGCAS